MILMHYLIHGHKLSIYSHIMIMFYLDQNLYGLSSSKKERLLSLHGPLSQLDDPSLPMILMITNI